MALDPKTIKWDAPAAPVAHQADQIKWDDDGPDRWQNTIARGVGALGESAVQSAGVAADAVIGADSFLDKGLSHWFGRKPRDPVPSAALAANEFAQAMRSSKDELFPAPAATRELERGLQGADGFLASLMQYVKHPVGTAQKGIETLVSSVPAVRALGAVGGGAAIAGGSAGVDAGIQFDDEYKQGIVQNSPEFKKLEAKHGTEKARDLLKEQRVQAVTGAGAAVGGLMAGVTRAAGLNPADEIIAGKAANATNQGFARQILTESAGEVAEEVPTQIATNVAAGATGSEAKWSDNVGAAAAGGLALGSAAAVPVAGIDVLARRRSLGAIDVLGAGGEAVPALEQRQRTADQNRGDPNPADAMLADGLTTSRFLEAVDEYAATLAEKRDGTPDRTVTDEDGNPFVVKGSPPVELSQVELEQLQAFDELRENPARLAELFGLTLIDSDTQAQPAPQLQPEQSTQPEQPQPSGVLALPPPEPIQVDSTGTATTPAQREQRMGLGITPDIQRIIASQQARENAPVVATTPEPAGVPTNEGQVPTGQDAAQQNATVQGQVDAGQEGQAGLLTAKAPQETAAPAAAPEAVADPVATTPEQETARQDLDVFKTATRSRGVVSIPVPQGSNAEAVRKALKRAGVRGVMTAAKGVVKLQHNQVDVFDAWIKNQESTNAGPTAEQPAAAAAGPGGGIGGVGGGGDGAVQGTPGATGGEPARVVRTWNDKVFKPEVHDVLDWIALNGGLDRDAFKSEGIDPAEWGGRRNGNQRFLGRPLFRKGGGMKADGLREALQGAGFIPEDPPDAPPQTGSSEALDMLDKAMRGGRVMLSEGQDADYAAAETRRFEEEQDRVERWLGAQPEDMRSLYEADPDAIFALMAHDGTNLPPEERIELDRVAPEDEAGARSAEEWLVELRQSGVDQAVAVELTLDLSFAKSAADKAKAVEAVANAIKEAGNVVARTGDGNRSQGVRAETEARAEPGSAEPTSPEPVAGSNAPAREAAAEPVAPTPAAPTDLFGAKPVKEQALADAKAKVDAKLTGGNVGMLQGDGELFAGPRPEQADLTNPQAATVPPDRGNTVVATTGPADAKGARKFYVTMIRDSKVARIAGPFDTKEEADAILPEARDKAKEVDPRAVFDAFGVSAVTTENHKPGSLNKQLGIGQQQPAPVVAKSATTEAPEAAKSESKAEPATPPQAADFPNGESYRAAVRAYRAANPVTPEATKQDRRTEIKRELADLKQSYMKRMNREEGSVPPAIKGDALAGIARTMDKLEAELRALDAENIKRMEFDVRGSAGRFYIAKKSDPEIRHLMDFTSVEDARKALTEQYDALVAAWDAVKARETAAKTSAKVEDFGSILLGARKHYAQAYADKVKDALGLDVAKHPLSKTWPEPDYDKLLESGADPFVTAWVHAARDEIPTKPSSSWKLKGWVESVTMLRDVSNKLLSGEIAKDKLTERIDSGRWRAVQAVTNRAELYEAVGHGKSLKGITLSEHHYSLYRGENNVHLWAVEKQAKATAFGNWPTEIATGKTKADALAAFKAKMTAAEAAPEKEAKGTTFEIYGSTANSVFFIGKKVNRRVLTIKAGFTAVKDARAYLAEHKVELEAAFEKMREIPEERRASNAPRVGIDHRAGGDVTPEKFADAFGFRGVQFGNYVEAGRRQRDLNDAYDALHDLAGVLGVPTRALSLNGELGLAFGARGKGGKRPASAHYEPGTVVINLTKGSGAGSLAHEWWHAIDNYFARMAGDKGGFMSRTTYIDPRVRLAMRESFQKLRRAIASTRLQERSRRLDDLRTKDYWTTEHEMSARAFESYVIAKLEDQSAANDYLANIVSEDGFGIEDGYPYPTAGELPAIRTAFDDFFSTIETRDNGGVIAFLSRSSIVPGDGSAKGMSVLEAQSVADDFLASYNGNIPLQVRVAAKQEDLYGPKATPERVGVIKGAYHAKSNLLTLAAVHLQDRADAARTLRHETLGHFGLNTLTPADKLDLLQKVVASKDEKGLAELWAKVDEHYSDKSEIERAEEVFAFAAEQDRGTLGRAWDLILSMLAKALRAIGLTKGMVTMPELHQLAHRISEGIRTGKAKQQTFPDRDDAQFSREEVADLANLGASLRDATGSDLARRAAAQFIGKPLTNRDTGIKATVSMSALGKMLSNSAVQNSVSRSAHAMAVANLDKLFPLAIRRLTRADNEGSVAVGAIHHFDVPMPFDGDVLRVKMLVKELRQGGQGNRLYTVAAVEIEKPASERGDSTVLTDQARLPTPPAGFDDRFAQMVRVVKGEPDAPLSLDDAKLRKDTAPPTDEDGVVRDLPDPQPKPPSSASQRTRAAATAQQVKALLELHAMGITRRAAGWDYDGNKWQGLSGSARRLREKFQDSMIAMRDVQEGIEGSIAQALDDGLNVYRMENLMRDRVGDRQQMLERTKVEPLMAHLKRAGLSMDQLHDYLLARAAPERNAKIAKINADMPDAGSGMTTANAAAIMRGELAGPYSGKVLSDADLRALGVAAGMVDGIRKFTLDTLQESGMLSGAQRASLEADKFYVPMRGRGNERDADAAGEDPAAAVGGRRPTTLLRRSNNPNIERALGRGEGNLPQNILPEMISDAQQALFDAELVRVKRALLKQAIAYPNPGVWEVEPVRTEYRFDKLTGEARLTVVNSAEDADSTLVVPMPNGKTYRLRFADPDLQRAIMTMGDQDMKGFVRWFGAINRWQSAVFTRFNPGFVPVNLVRDLGFGLTAVATNYGPKVLGETVAGYTSAAKALVQDANSAPGDASKPIDEKSMIDFAREFAQSGGKMNIVGYEDVDTIARDLAVQVRSLNDLWADGRRGLAFSESVRRAVTPAFGLIEKANDAIENALRLSLYASLRRSGKSVEQAAEAAKNITVNFRRKGSMGAIANSIYLFFNAGVQGAHATLRLLSNKKVLAGLTAMGALQGLFAWMLMEQDDDEDGVSAWDAIPSYRRERSLVIPTGLLFGGDPKHVTMIPLQYGFNLFPYLGGRLAQRAHDELNGTVRPKDNLVGDMARATVNSFIPVPIYEGPEALLGNLVQIFGQLKANKDDLGRPITSENPFAKGDPPRSAMGRDTTSSVWKAAATALNRLGGGDDWTPPYILPWLTNVSPEQLDFLWSQVAGGVGSTFSRGLSAAEGLAVGRFDSAGELMAATPIINAFGGTFRDDRATADRYYALGDEVERAKLKEDGLSERGDDDAADAVGDSVYGQLEWRWKNTQKQVQRFNKQLRAVRIDPEISPSEREAEIKRITRERAEAQRRFLQDAQERSREAA